MIHFTSDPHFFHGKMADHRGFANVTAMNDHMIEAHNRVVRPDDLVFFLGDISFVGGSRTREVLAELHGQLHLIPGNHDRGMNALTQMMFDVHPPIYELKVPINQQTTGKADVHRFVLCHFPLLSWNRMHHKAMHLHGHSHGTCKYPHPDNRILDVGVDATANWYAPRRYAPVSLTEVLAVMSTRSFNSPDQHEEKNDE